MKIIIGKVISKKMKDTATVRVVRNIAHPNYKKRIKIAKKYQVQDNFNTVVGEMVKFVECMPISKTKRWKITEVVGRKKEAKALSEKERKQK